MSMNEEIAGRNRDLVYGKAKEFFEKHAVVPKQAEIIALCPNISRPTVRKYLEEWLKENNKSYSDDDEDDLSPELLAAWRAEIRNKKANAHQKIHDRLKEIEGANDVLAAENEDLNAQLQNKKSEIEKLNENIGYYIGQFEMQGEEIGKLTNELQSAENRMQLYEKSEQEALTREREITGELREALVREQQAQAELAVLREATKNSEVLSKALMREEWFEQITKQADVKAGRSREKSGQAVRPSLKGQLCPSNPFPSKRLYLLAPLAKALIEDRFDKNTNSKITHNRKTIIILQIISDISSTVNKGSTTQ